MTYKKSERMLAVVVVAMLSAIMAKPSHARFGTSASLMKALNPLKVAPCLTALCTTVAAMNSAEPAPTRYRTMTVASMLCTLSEVAA